MTDEIYFFDNLNNIDLKDWAGSVRKKSNEISIWGRNVNAASFFSFSNAKFITMCLNFTRYYKRDLRFLYIWPWKEQRKKKRNLMVRKGYTHIVKRKAKSWVFWDTKQFHVLLSWKVVKLTTNEDISLIPVIKYSRTRRIIS